MVALGGLTGALLLLERFVTFVEETEGQHGRWRVGTLNALG